MSPEQLLAFELGSGRSAAAVVFAIASIVLLLAMVWAMWVIFGHFRSWQDGSASLFDVAWGALRVSILLMVLGYYLR